MKKSITFLLISFIALRFYAQTALPNGDFETWQSAGSYENPSPTSFWTTLNAIGSLNPAAITVSKSTDAISGTYSARIETKLVGTFLVAGVVTSGSFDLLSQKLTQGQPFTDKPSHLTGFYKYTSVNGDSFTIAIELSKWMNNQHTVLGGSFLKGNQTVSSYTPFDLVCDYSNFPNETPDSITVTFTSSAGGANFQGAAGSTLWIDGVALEYDNVGIENTASASFAALYPNPAHDVLYLKTIDNQPLSALTLYNLAGQKVLVENLSPTQTYVSIAELPQGLYFYTLTATNGVLFSGKLNVKS